MIAMTPSRMRGLPAAMLAAVVVAASSSATRAAAQTSSSPPADTSAAARQSELDAIAKARADSVRHPYTKADIDFMTGMISHHSQAILMAGWAPTHGASPSVQTLC